MRSEHLDRFVDDVLAFSLEPWGTTVLVFALEREDRDAAADLSCLVVAELRVIRDIGWSLINCEVSVLSFL